MGGFKVTTGRLVGAGLVLAIFVMSIASIGGSTRDPGARASIALRELRPAMLALAQLHDSCAPAGDAAPGRGCTADDYLQHRFARALDLRAARGCVAPRAACVSVAGGQARFELVSRRLPRIGGIRVEAVAPVGSNRLSWRCRPIRTGSGDAELVRRACGDLPRA